MNRRRFIAGAECPYCHATDRIVVELDIEGAMKTRRCLSCEHEEEMHDLVEPSKSEHNTSEVQVVRFDG